MQRIPELIYATALEKNRIGATTDRVALRGMIKTIDQLAPQNSAATPAGEKPEIIEAASPLIAAQDVINEIKALHDAQKPGSVSITLIGMNYRSAHDHARAHAIVQAIRADTIKPSLIIFERDLSYGPSKIPCPIIHEEDLTTSREGNFGRGLTRAQRCMVVAGYVHLCLTASEQSGMERILLFFDGHQSGILSEFSYFVQNTRTSTLKSRPFNMLTIGIGK